MKNVLNLLIVFLFPSLVFCQISAITQFGDKVILHDDFTWSYAADEIQSSKIMLRNIEVDTAGMVHLMFSGAGNNIFFYDGKIFCDNLQNIQIRYHDNSFFAKSVGKINQLTINSMVITFDYHENFIFDKSEGKIKRIMIGNKSFTFDYHENSYFAKSVGKIEQIASGSDKITFEYFENSIFGETEGKLKEIKGTIPGIKIQYVE